MKVGILVLMIGLALSACHSEKKLMARRAGFVNTQPVGVTVQETVQDTLVIEETPESARPEKVTKTQGADLMHYCVIVGSFIYEQNAVNLRNSLMRQGFLGSSIMQNAEGMYRVSAECNDSHAGAWQDVCRIRREFPQFHDAWLLETRN